MSMLHRLQCDACEVEFDLSLPTERDVAFMAKSAGWDVAIGATPDFCPKCKTSRNQGGT